MARRAIFILLVVFASLTVTSQNTHRRGAKRTAVAAQTTAAVAYANDTIADADVIGAKVRVDDFRKATVSRVESVMLTNLTKTDTILGLEVDIDYRTEDGRQLNRRTVTLRATVPPGETRFVSFNSFDRQQLFYYRGTPPAKPTARTTPFDVTITPLRLIIAK